jgi:acyl carrier protein
LREAVLITDGYEGYIMASIMNEIRAIINDKAGVAEELIKPGSTLAGLGLDDLDAVEFLMELEKTFTLTLSEDEEEKLVQKTLQGMADYVAAKIRQ